MLIAIDCSNPMFRAWSARAQQTLSLNADPISLSIG